MTIWERYKKYGHLRDSQRSKVISGDHGLMALDGTLTRREVQALVSKVCYSRWWQAQIKRVNEFNEAVGCPRYIKRPDRPLILFKGGDRNIAYANPYRWILTIPAWAQQEIVILHELAHLLTPKYLPDHGRYFANTFLRIVKRWMGEETHKKLKNFFDKTGVKYRYQMRRYT